MKKYKNVILEQSEPPGPDWSIVSPIKVDEKKRLGCTVVEKNGINYYKKPCPSTSSSTTSQTTNAPQPTEDYKTDCFINDKFIKGCKDNYVSKLQSCLNKNEKSLLPQIKTDGIWTDETQEKLVEIYPEFIDGVSKNDIRKICSDFEKPKEITRKIKSLSYVDESGLNEQTKTVTKDVVETPYLTDNQFFDYLIKEKFVDSCIPWLLEPTKVSIETGAGGSVIAMRGYRIDENEQQVFYTFYRNYIVQNETTKETKSWANACPNFNERIREITSRQRQEPITIKFGINLNLEPNELVNELNTVTEYLNRLIAINVVSNDIISWSKFINKYYGDNKDVKKIENPEKAKQPDAAVLDKHYIPMDLNKYFPNWKIKVWKPKEKSDPIQRKYIETDDPATCKEILIDYLQYAMQGTSGTITEPLKDIQYYKSRIQRCNNKNAYSTADWVLTNQDVLQGQSIRNNPFDVYKKGMTWKDVVRYLKGTSKQYTGKSLPLGNSYIISNLQEQLVLRSKIALTLNEMVEEKRTLTLQEKVVKSRVNLLFENTTFKSRKQRSNFVNNLVNEAFNLKTQGIDKKIIKEEFWDVLKSFVGNDKTNSVFISFKTKMADWLIDKMSPKKADGWIGATVRKTIQDVDIRDVEHITECEFLTERITNSIITKLNEKISNENLSDEGVYDIIRVTMSDGIKGEKFKRDIKTKIKDMICPLLSDVTTKFNKEYENMKNRAIIGK